MSLHFGMIFLFCFPSFPGTARIALDGFSVSLNTCRYAVKSGSQGKEVQPGPTPNGQVLSQGRY
jgi:hypothetical protein